MSTFLIAFLFLFSPVLAHKAHSLDHVHVCTVASYWHVNLEKLIQSCKLHQIKLNILGMYDPYPNNGIKYIRTLDFIENLPDDDILLFVDAFDVLVVADKETIVQKFLEMDVPFVMAAERYCSPFPDLEEGLPLSPTPFRFINTGTYMGYIGFIKKWLQELKPDPNTCDQEQTFMHYYNNPKKYCLDFNCELFLPLFLVKSDEIEICDNAVHCLTTDSYPCIIHANGHSFEIWEKIYHQLIAEEA